MRRTHLQPILLLLAVLCLAAFPRQVRGAGPERYSVQIASMADAGRAQRLYAALREDLGPELHSLLRVERVGALHAFRIGAFADRAEALQVLGELRARHPDASIILAPVRPDRILLPELPAGGQPPASPSPRAESVRTQPDAATAPSAPEPAASRPAPAVPSLPPAAEPAPETGAPPAATPEAAPAIREPEQTTSAPAGQPAPPPARPAPRPEAGATALATSWDRLIESLSSSRPLLAAALASALLLPLALFALLRAVRRRPAQPAAPAAAGPEQFAAMPAPDAEGENEKPAADASAASGPEHFASPASEPSAPEPFAKEPDAGAPKEAEPPGEDKTPAPGPEGFPVPSPEPPQPEPSAAEPDAGARRMAGPPRTEAAPPPGPEGLACPAPEFLELEPFAAESGGGVPEEAGPPPEDAVPALGTEFLRRMARNLRELSQVQGNLLSAAKEGRTFYVTSCFNGEGKTTAAVEMAYALSHSAGAKVLLVDWNPGAARLHELFGVSIGPGFGDYLASGDAAGCIRATTHPNLSLLTSGADGDACSGGGDGAIRRRLRERLSALRDRYDYVVYDGHSLIGTSAAILAREFDGIVLVVEAEKTKWEVVQSAREKIESIDGRLVGVVLNKRKFYIPRLLYGKI